MGLPANVPLVAKVHETVDSGAFAPKLASAAPWFAMPRASPSTEEALALSPGGQILNPQDLDSQDLLLDLHTADLDVFSPDLKPLDLNPQDLAPQDLDLDTQDLNLDTQDLNLDTQDLHAPHRRTEEPPLRRPMLLSPTQLVTAPSTKSAIGPTAGLVSTRPYAQHPGRRLSIQSKKQAGKTLTR